MISYLASPYTYRHANANFAQQMQRVRYGWAVVATAALVADYRKHVFSPIVHCHPLAEIRALPPEFTFWRDYNFAMLQRSCELLVLDVMGWRESTGVQGEIEMAGVLHRPVRFVRINKKLPGSRVHTVTICEEPQ